MAAIFLDRRQVGHFLRKETAKPRGSGEGSGRIEIRPDGFLPFPACRHRAQPRQWRSAATGPRDHIDGTTDLYPGLSAMPAGCTIVLP